MKVFNLEEMKDGWFIGNFSPAVLKTEDFEVGIKKIEKDSPSDPHYHKVAIEINLLLSGRIEIDQRIINAGEIFVFDKNEISSAKYLEDCTILVVKTPSVKNDKYKL